MPSARTANPLRVNKKQAKTHWRQHPDQTCHERPLPGTECPVSPRAMTPATRGPFQHVQAHLP